MSKKKTKLENWKVTKDARVGQGFSDARGDSYREKPGIPKNNGLNVHNDPASLKDKENTYKK